MEEILFHHQLHRFSILKRGNWVRRLLEFLSRVVRFSKRQKQNKRIVKFKLEFEHPVFYLATVSLRCQSYPFLKWVLNSHWIQELKYTGLSFLFSLINLDWVIWFWVKTKFSFPFFQPLFPIKIIKNKCRQCPCREESKKRFGRIIPDTLSCLTLPYSTPESWVDPLS